MIETVFEVFMFSVLFTLVGIFGYIRGRNAEKRQSIPLYYLVSNYTIPASGYYFIYRPCLCSHGLPPRSLFRAVVRHYQKNDYVAGSFYIAGPIIEPKGQINEK